MTGRPGCIGDDIARCFTKASAGMDDEPREQISELEVQIEELADALERCRKTALASKAAMVLGVILMAATTLGVVTFDPMVVIAGLAALLGGVVIFGSNTYFAFLDDGQDCLDGRILALGLELARNGVMSFLANFGELLVARAARARDTGGSSSRFQIYSLG